HLETPLKTFAVTHTQFIMAHLKNMSQCQRLHHLKHLDMTGTLLTCLCMAPLAALLENVAHTLESLQLQGCGITDSQLRVLLPALGQCSQLTWLDLYTNHFSMDALCDLLLHTANLSKMTVERYPAPLESYDEL
ncbi:PRAME family member 8-like, partial [Sigmodon hispidus]